jgi:hypothetical protein
MRTVFVALVLMAVAASACLLNDDAVGHIHERCGPTLCGIPSQYPIAVTLALLTLPFSLALPQAAIVYKQAIADGNMPQGKVSATLFFAQLGKFEKKHPELRRPIVWLLLSMFYLFGMGSFVCWFFAG